MSDKRSKLVRLLMDVGSAALKSEVQDRCRRIEPTPLGHLIRAGISRYEAAKKEGRELTDEDVAEFLEDVPAVVAFARAQEDGNGER